MIQFSFSTNGLVTKSEWYCDEVSSNVYLKDAMVHREVVHKLPMRPSMILQKTIEVMNSPEYNKTCNLWVYIKNSSNVYVMVFKHYYKRDNCTYQIPAQTDCVAATADRVWAISHQDMNLIKMDNVVVDDTYVA